MEELTYRVYWHEINDIAQSVIDEYDGEEAQNDRVYETVDGHQWVIYSAYHFDVLKHCSDENAYFEMFGEAPTGEDTHEILIKLVSAAMVNDVQSALQTIRDAQKGSQS